MIRAVIVDDEPLARDVLRIRLSEEDGIEVVGEAANATKMWARVDQLKPDVVFLDVVMPGENGLEAARGLGGAEGPAIVFVTAHAEHALRAFEVAAQDYLCKPFSTVRLRATLARLRDRLAARSAAREQRQLRALLKVAEHGGAEPTPPVGVEMAGNVAGWIPIREGDRYVMVDVRDIFWIEAAANYVLVHLEGATHRARSTLGAFERRLDAGLFARVHRAAIVNRRRIREIRPTWHGDYLVRLTNDAVIRLSRGYRSALLGAGRWVSAE